MRRELRQLCVTWKFGNRGNVLIGLRIGQCVWSVFDRLVACFEKCKVCNEFFEKIIGNVAIERLK